jgi:ABC-2 type transport system permease protein
VKTTAPVIQGTPPMPVPPATPLGRARWAVVDGWTIARRDLLHWVREPTRILGTLVFPIVFVVLFGYVFGSAMSVPGGGAYREFLMPGMFAQTMMFGIGTTMTAVIADTAAGVTDRFRSMPMAPSAILTGRSLADIVNSVIDVAILVGCGYVVGWRPHGGVAETLAAVGLLLLLRFACVWIGIYLGLLIPSVEASGAVWGLLFPFTMIANTFVAPSQMPDWLGVLAEWNPLSSTVAATRELFGNPGIEQGSWVAEHPVLMAVVWPSVLVGVFFLLSMRRYRGLSR